MSFEDEAPHPTCFPTNHTRWAPTIVINGVITPTRVSMEVIVTS